MAKFLDAQKEGQRRLEEQLARSARPVEAAPDGDNDPPPSKKSEKAAAKGFEGLGPPDTTFNEYDLSVLTEKRDVAFRLKFGWRLSNIKIAERMSITRQMVAKHLANAKKILNKNQSRVKARRNTE